MTSLQQVLQAPISEDPSLNVVAVHRRSVTLLVNRDNSVYTTRQDSAGNWVEYNEWLIPASTGRVLGYFPLEAYSSFVIILECNKAVVVTFLDLSGNLLNSWPVNGIELDAIGSCTADIDQNRRELILSTSKNDLYSIALRGVVHQQNKGVKDLATDIMLFEALVRVKGHLNPRSTPPPLVIACFDLQGSFITLNNKGQIMGFETASLDILWVLEPAQFLYKPTYIFANRFGSGFFVYSHSQVNNVSRLEYWSPPDTSSGCGAGRFTRAVVPLSAALTSLNIESLGKGIGTYAVIVQSDRQVVLWKIVNKNKVMLDAKITLTDGYKEVFKERTIDKAFKQLSKYLTLQESTGKAWTKLSLRNMLPGIISFSAGEGIPDSPMTILITVGNVFAFLSMHVPRESDLKWLGWTHDEFRCGLTEAEERREDMKHTRLSELEDRLSLTTAKGPNSPEPAAAVTQQLTDGIFVDDDEEIVLKTVVADPTVVASTKAIPGATSVHNRGGELVNFSPLALVDSATFVSSRKSLAAEPKEGTIGLVLPASVVAMTALVGNEKNSKYKCDVHLVQRGGLFLPYDVSSVAARASVDVIMGAFAYRSRKLVALSTLKELFWMPLPALPSEQVEVHHRPPVKVGVDIKAVNVSITALSVGDVFMKLPADKLSSDAPRGLGAGAAVVSGGIIGNWTITFAGDSTGNVHFYLTSDDGVVQQDQFKAHNSNPIVSILLTGDAMRPLWRFAASNTAVAGAADDVVSKSGRFVSGNNKMKVSGGTGKSAQLRCLPAPGSALVTVARDGEVKVWQPVFTQLPRSKADISQLLNIFNVSWRMSGIFVGLGSPYLYISSAVLDPTCMTVMLSTSNGFVLQWPLPGLMDTNSGSIATCRDSIFSCRRHDTSVSSMRVWVDSPNTAVHDVAQPSGINSKDIKFAAMIRGPLSGTIGYTTQELQYISGNSSFVTSATDSSIVLWRFTLSKVFQGPDSVGGGSRYLCPTPCRRLFFSSVPHDGICYPLFSAQQKDAPTSLSNMKATGSTLQWRVSVLLNGVVVSASQASYYTLFDASGFNGENTGATLESALPKSQLDSSAEYDGSEDQDQEVEDKFDNGDVSQATGIILQMIPSLVNVLKPNRLAVLAPKKIGETVNSWNLLNTEWLHRNAEDQVNTQLEISLVGIGEFASRASETSKLYEAFQSSRPSSPTSGGRSRDHSRSPEHRKRIGVLPDKKFDVGVDGEISVMTGIRVPKDVPDKPSPTRNDGLVPVMRNGYRVLVTPEQADDLSEVIASSKVENNRMVYISPEKRMDERKVSPNPTFEGEVSLFSSLNTPFLNSGAPRPLSPQGMDDELTVKRTRSLNHIPQPPSSKVLVSQSPYGSKNNCPLKPRRTSTPELGSLRKTDMSDEKSIGIDLQSRQCDTVSTDTSKSPGRSLKGVGKSFVGRVPSVGVQANHTAVVDIDLTPKASMDYEENASVDSEFDPTYIEATMSLMSGSTGVVGTANSDSTVKFKNSGIASSLDLQSAVDIRPASPQTPSKIPKRMGGKTTSPILKADVLSVHLPFDDEAPVVDVETVSIKDDASDVSDIDVVLSVPGKPNVKPKALNAAEQRTQKIKYVSKKRAAGPVVHGRVVLQPYATPKIGFVPSKNFYEKKMEEGRARVVVEKKSNSRVPKYDVPSTAESMEVNSHNKLSRTTVGVVEDGENKLVIRQSSDFKQHDKYFDWSSDPLFVLRGPVNYAAESDAGFDLMSSIPDDHAMFSQVDNTISQDEIIKDLSQFEASQLKRMNEDERALFLKEKSEDHDREVEASKHFFREMLCETAGARSSAGGPKKRNALQKTTLSIMHLMKWGVVSRAVENGAMSHDDLEEILKKAVEEERDALTTAEKERKIKMEDERKDSMASGGPAELNPMDYSDTESETSLRSKGGSIEGLRISDSFQFEEEDDLGYRSVNVEGVNGMEGVATRPVSEEESRSKTILSRGKSPGDDRTKNVQFTDSPPRSRTRSISAPKPFDDDEALKKVAEEGGVMQKHTDGSQTYVTKQGIEYRQTPGDKYFVKVSLSQSPELTVRKNYASAGSAGEVTSSQVRSGSEEVSTPQLRSGAMVSRSKRDELVRTPKRRKAHPKKHNFAHENDSDEDLSPQLKRAFMKKGKGSDLRTSNETLKEIVASTAVVNKAPGFNASEDRALAGLVNPTALPADGEITFLGFSKFLRAVNAKVAQAAMPPEVTAHISECKHDSVKLKFNADKKCCVWAIATEEGSLYIPSNNDFDNLKGLMNNAEVIAMTAGIIGEEDEEDLELELTLRVLKAEKKYKIYFCSDLVKKTKSDGKGGDKYAARTPDIVIEDECISVKTKPEPPEYLDIEWNKLSLKQQEVEVKAAARSLSVQAAARLVGKTIPNDEDISMKNKPAQIPAMKKWNNFVSWWTGEDATLGFSAPRIEFQSDEIIFMVQDDELRRACFDQGYLSESDMNNINSFIFDMSSVDMTQDGLIPTENLTRSSDIDMAIFDDPSFQFFRSWYKGGRICERQQFWNSPAREVMQEMAKNDIQETNIVDQAKIDDENDENSTVFSLNDSISVAPSPVMGQFKTVLSDIPFDAEQGKKTSEARLINRTDLLQKRIQYVESQKSAAMKLLELHKYCEKESLRFTDLQTKRNSLSQQDIDALMASRKLSELCRHADVELFRLPGQFMQRVSKSDIFKDVPKGYMLPDHPPPLILGNGEDGGKMPVKLWNNCGDLEKELECRVACMLDPIAELAIFDGVCVPSIEDADVDDALVPARSNKWKKFVDWYVGPEKNTNAVTSFSKGRMTFSDWERKAAGANFFVHLRLRGKPPSVIVGDTTGAPSMDDEDSVSLADASIRTEETADSLSVVTRELSIEPTDMSMAAQVARIQKQQETVVDQYTDTVNTHSGAEMRIDLFAEYVAGINSSRYASVMRCMWPSAPPRQALQFMFPRMGIIIPTPEAHTLHMKLYASRKNDGYTIKDILKFYTNEELNEDDLKMQGAEEKGKKFEEYIVWLSKEKERVAEGRDMMLAEDVSGMKFRIMQENLARKLADPVGVPTYSGFAVATQLKGDYQSIADGTSIFADGDGCLNEDEIFDIKDDMIRRAREGFLALQEKKRIAIEDLKKAEELERVRLEKQDREKRIQEGVVRRQNIRAKLALLKEERELKAMCAHRDKLLAEEDEKKRLAHELAERMAADKIREELESETREQVEMSAEEARQRQLERLQMNRYGMEQEDTLSHLREELDSYADEITAERIADLKELYRPHVPFEFKKRLVETGWLDGDERDPFYDRVDVPASPTGSRFPSDKKKRVPNPTVFTAENGELTYPLTKSAKFHASGGGRHIRYPDVTVKETRFNSPPRYPSPIVEKKVATILESRKASKGHESIPRFDAEGDWGIVPPVAPNVSEMFGQDVKPLRRTEVVFKPDTFLPAIAHHAQSAPLLRDVTQNETAESALISNSTSDAELVLPVLSGAPTKKSGGSELGFRQLSTQDDLKYVISRDIAGLQNRKKLLRASLSGLDHKKDFTKAPRARVKEHTLKTAAKVVEKVRSKRDDVRSYLSESCPDEILEDKYYLMACQPGIRLTDSVNTNQKETVQDFRKSLFQGIVDYELEINSHEAITSPNNFVSTSHDAELNQPPEKDVYAAIDDDSVNSVRPSLVIGDNTAQHMTQRSATGKNSSRRRTPALPQELEFPVDKIDYRQVNVPPPFYKKTFGILGSRKDIGVSPKVLLKSESTTGLRKKENKF